MFRHPVNPVFPQVGIYPQMGDFSRFFKGSGDFQNESGDWGIMVIFGKTIIKKAKIGDFLKIPFKL